MATFNDMINNIRALQKAGPEAAAAQKIATETLITELQNLSKNTNISNKQVTKSIEFLQKEQAIIQKQINEKMDNLERPSNEEFQAMSGSIDPNIVAEFAAEWEKSKREELGITQLENEQTAAGTQIEHLQAISKIPSNIENVIDQLKSGNELTEDQLNNAQNLLKVTQVYGEKYDDINKTLKSIRHDNNSIKEMWKNIPGKIGEKLSGTNSFITEMFGSELVGLIGKVGSGAQAVTQRLLNPAAAVAEATERFGTIKDMFSSPVSALSGLKEGLGLGVTGAFAERVSAGRSRMDNMRGILPTINMGLGGSDVAQNTGESADRLAEIADYLQPGSEPGSFYVHDTHVEAALKNQQLAGRNKSEGFSREQRNWRSFLRRSIRDASDRGMEHLKTSKLANFLSKDNFFKMFKLFSKGGFLGTALSGFRSIFDGSGGMLGLLRKIGGGLLKVAGPLVGVAAAAATIYDVGSNIYDAYKTWNNPNATTEQKGGAVGKAVGSTGGAVAGGIIGSVFGPIGTAVGAWLGNKVGGVVGEWVGEKIAPTVAKLWDAGKEFFSNIGDGISSAWKSVTNAIGSAWDGLTNTLSSTWDSVTGAIGGAWDNITSSVGSAWDRVTDTLSEGWETYTGVYKSAWEGIKSVGGSVWESVTGWFSDTKEKVTEAYAEDGTLGAAWTMLKETNPLINLASTGASNFTGWFKSLWGGNEETEIITNNQDTSNLLASTSYTQEELTAAVTAAVNPATEKLASPEGLSGKFDNLAKLQEQTAGTFSTGLSALLEAIQSIRIQGPIVTSQNIPANVPSDIDSLGMMMTNKVWGTV